MLSSAGSQCRCSITTNYFLPEPTTDETWNWLEKIVFLLLFWVMTLVECHVARETRRRRRRLMGRGTQRQKLNMKMWRRSRNDGDSLSLFSYSAMLRIIDEIFSNIKFLLCRRAAALRWHSIHPISSNNHIFLRSSSSSGLSCHSFISPLSACFPFGSNFMWHILKIIWNFIHFAINNWQSGERSANFTT